MRLRIHSHNQRHGILITSARPVALRSAESWVTFCNTLVAGVLQVLRTIPRLAPVAMSFVLGTAAITMPLVLGTAVIAMPLMLSAATAPMAATLKGVGLLFAQRSITVEVSLWMVLQHHGSVFLGSG